MGRRRASDVKREEEAARAPGSQGQEGQEGREGQEGQEGREGQEGLVASSSARFRDTPLGVNEVARRVLIAAVEVHRHLGPGYLESVYQAALEIELGLRGVRFERHMVFRVDYKGQGVGAGQMDLLVEQTVVVELKAVEHLNDVHTAQALSYLKATGLSLALLINFQVPVLLRGVKRVARNQRLEAQGEADESLDSPLGQR